MRFTWLVSLSICLFSLCANRASATSLLCAEAHLDSFKVQTSIGTFANTDSDYCQIPVESVPSVIKRTLKQITQLENQIAKLIAQNYHLKLEHLTSVPIQIILQGNIAGSLDSSSNFPALSLGVFKDWSGEAIDASNFIHEFVHLLMNDPATKLPKHLIKFAKLPIFSEQIPDIFAIALTHQSLQGTGLPACAARAIHGDDHSRSFQLPLENFTTSHWIPEMLACCASAVTLETSTSHFSEFCRMTRSSQTTAPSCTLSLSGKTHGCSVHAISVPITSFLSELKHYSRDQSLGFYFNALKSAKNTATLFHTVRAQLDLAGQIQFDRLWTEFKMDTALSIATAEERSFPAASI